MMHMPSKIGRYRIESQLGAGGMGIVYKARGNVVIKTIRPDAANDDARRRFMAEAEMTRRLSHPNIVRVLEFGIDAQNMFWMAMEFLPGGTLTAWLGRQRRITVGGLIKALHKVAAGLDHAHRHGVIHRDLKPDNILIDKRGNPKIADFGLAKDYTQSGKNPNAQLTQTGSVMGTMVFMAPEQLIDPRRVTGQADIYALAALTYLLLTGTLPVPVPQTQSGQINLEQFITLLIGLTPKPPSSLNSRLNTGVDRVLLRALNKQPAQRYSSASEFVRDLDSSSGRAKQVALNVQPVASGAKSGTISQKERRAFQRAGQRRRLFRTPLVIILLLAILLGAIAWGLATGVIAVP